MFARTIRFSLTITLEVPMKHTSHSRLVLAAFGLLSVAASSTAYAEFKCDQPQLTRVDATACAKAAEGAAALRQYVWRTQRIYGLQMSDYARFEGEEPKPNRARAAQVKPRDTVAVSPQPAR